MFFDEPINRKGTQCTQWDYVEDRFGEKTCCHLRFPIRISRCQLQLKRHLSSGCSTRFLGIHVGIIMNSSKRSANGILNVLTA